VAVCNPGFAFRANTCLPAPTASFEARVDPSALKRSYSARAPLFDDIGRYRTGPNTGSTFDVTSGNSYTWSRSAAGTTSVSGVNINTGSIWRTTIQPDGSMRGWDKDMNPWTYNAASRLYVNYGTGKICVGEGVTRVCY